MPGERQTTATDEPEGRDGMLLRQVQIELRALRAEIAQLSRVMGFTSTISNRVSYRGVLQQLHPLNGPQGLDAHREDAVREELRAETAVERREVREREAEIYVRRVLARKVHQRRQELLRALQRAEQRLEDAPESLPPGLRDSLIGEIYRARYGIALFGGVGGVVTTGGIISLAA
jgi:hypothetical protein